VTSVSGAAAAVGRPLVERDEVLTVLPGTLPADELAEWLATTDSAAVLKLGRTFPAVREAFDRAGVLDRALYVERATTDRERALPLADVDPGSVPYFSLALLPSPLTGPAPAPEAPAGAPHGGEVAVVGLGPGDRCWTTPEAADVLAAADDLVGYGPYLARVPANPRQRRHASDNRVEAERAAHALSLARDGRRVAVVSSGDPGVFAMAAAVLEVAERPEFAGVPVRVVPGLTAAQAVAARVGAPLGHDFAVLSLSDVRKPWDVVVDRLRHAAAADLVIALYNPRSTARPHQLGEAQKVLLENRSPDTVVVVGPRRGRAGGADHRHHARRPRHRHRRHALPGPGRLLADPGLPDRRRLDATHPPRRARRGMRPAEEALALLCPRMRPRGCPRAG
jgi:precorrin-2 C20-methyltransferase/precorrin-3B C17-methyltransferase